MKMRNWIRRFRSDESGATSAEFLIAFPILVFMFSMGMELSFWNTRELLLRRATNIVVRDVRLNTGTPPTYDQMKAQICAHSIFTTNCLNDIRVVMMAKPLSGWRDMTERAPCIDREEEVDPLTEFLPGVENELMIVQVCRLFDPIFPGGSLGRRLPENSDGEYGVRVTTAFVTEPL